MSQTMPSPDAALKDFFKNNEIFAAVFNSCFFDNKPVIKADELESENTAYTTTIKLSNKGKNKFKTETINRYRDNIRRTSLGYLVILGIEDQNNIHYSMPVRTLMYDALGYSSELSAISKSQEIAEWTVDEWLSKVKKGTKITPIITTVFYTGSKPWDGPRSLHDMMDMDERIKKFVPDYPLYVIDIGHDEGLSFDNKELNELKDTLYSIYTNTADKNEQYVGTSTVALAGILTGDEKLYYSASKSKGGYNKMCEQLVERDKIIFKEVRDELAAAKANLAETEANLAETEADLAAAREENERLKQKIKSLEGKQ